MRLLLRKLTTDQTGLEEYTEAEIAGEILVLGSAPECDIAILGAGVEQVHARLQRVGKKIRLSAERGAKLLGKGKISQQMYVEPGDDFEIGGQKFHCFTPPRGFDLALQWQQVEIDGSTLAAVYCTSLGALGFSLRKLSWSLALGILLVAGLVPLIKYFYQPALKQAMTLEHGMTLETLWLSGPLLPAHQVALGNNCSACHQRPFEQARDTACQTCHKDLGDHLPPGHSHAVQFELFACQNCHKEHNEPPAIVNTSDGLCRTCHEQLEPQVRGFSSGRHPEFALNLLQPEVTAAAGVLSTTWHSQKTAPGPGVSETSHLKFPHNLHLNAAEVTHAQRGDPLQCVDCHRLSPDGEHFVPITMEANCSSCHSLEFDARFPRQQLPHGSAQEVYRALESHYVQLAFAPGEADLPERRRLPGRTAEDEQCVRDFACAQRQARRTADVQFSRQGCVTCHDVRQAPAADSAGQWQVLPVKLNSDWYISARFDHKSHLTQAELSGDDLCLTCHAAPDSKVSADILMPPLAQCTQCHGDQAVDNRVPLNCVACHGYHGVGGEVLPPGMNHVVH
jgi:predicted CXXCH cytochrome family protein